jgi:excisionase family DNA binding protein
MLERVAYSPDEAAQLLGVHRGTIYNLKKRGEIEFVKIGRRTLVPRSEIERLTATERSSTSATATIE